MPAPMTFEVHSENNGVSSGGGGVEESQIRVAGLSSVGASMSVIQTIQSQQITAGPPRSRITVVCAECKRLKLRCDRRTPCGSCVKRGTVHRCTYSAAAVEKVDVQSLHNRILILEEQIIAIQSNPSILLRIAGGINSKYDRALLAIGQGGSSLAISLDDIAAIWLDELDLTKDGIELSPAVPPQPPDKTQSRGAIGTLELYTKYGDLFKIPISSSSAGPSTSLVDVGVTTQLISCLPSEPLRSQFLNHLEKTLIMHPCVNFLHFKAQITSMHQWAESEGGFHHSSCSSESSSSTARQRPSLSFFAAAAIAYAIGAQSWIELNGNDFPVQTGDHSEGFSEFDARGTHSSDKSSLTFELNDSTPHTLYKLSILALSLYSERHTYGSYDLNYLHALILRILYLLHASSGPQVSHELFPLIGSMVNIARMMGLGIDPEDIEHTASKTNSTGRQSILADGEVKKMSLFDKEFRRRLWWDVFYYDLFISDCMDSAPLIPDDANTTCLPTDVDETLFRPESTSLPLSDEEDSDENNQYTSITYLIQKYRLARLVKSVKKRTFRDPTASAPTNSELSIDQAAQFESEVQQWLAELPEKLKLPMDPNWSNALPLPAAAIPSADSNTISSDPAFLIAQRCELVCVANRLLLKLYIPFLRSSRNKSGVQLKTHPHAVMATINAAHTIIHASRVLHKVLRLAHPASYMFYSFARSIFDAAVISAYNVIHEPRAVYSRVAMEDVIAALEILRDPVVSTGRGPVRGGVEGSPSEAVRIVEVLKAKAQSAMNGGSGPVNAGTKRKHGQLDSDNVGAYQNFQVPFVGVGVVNNGVKDYIPVTSISEDTSSTSYANSTTNRSSAPTPVPSNNYYAKTLYEKEGASDAVNSSSSSGRVSTPKERVGKMTQQYPSIGIRERSVRQDTSSKPRRGSSTSSRSGMPISQAPTPAIQSMDAADMITPFRVTVPLPTPRVPERSKETVSTDYSTNYHGEYDTTRPSYHTQTMYEQGSSAHVQDVYAPYTWAASSATIPRNDRVQQTYMTSSSPDYLTPQPIPHLAPSYNSSQPGLSMYANQTMSRNMPTLETPHSQGLRHSVPSTPHDHRYPLSIDTSYPGPPSNTGHQEVQSAPVNSAQIYGRPQLHQHQPHQMSAHATNPSQIWSGPPNSHQDFR